MRNLQSATQIYKSHVAAVMSVGYSPTGQELVSGSYDRTLRLWTVNAGSQSRDVYHLARMQRIFACAFTYDARFVVSASDDGNVRLFKARAGEKLGIQSGRERAALEYRQRLKDKWGSTGDVRKIERQRNIPKQITGASKLKRTMLEAERVKEERRRKHTKVHWPRVPMCLHASLTSMLHRLARASRKLRARLRSLLTRSELPPLARSTHHSLWPSSVLVASCNTSHAQATRIRLLCACMHWVWRWILSAAGADTEASSPHELRGEPGSPEAPALAAARARRCRRSPRSADGDAGGEVAAGSACGEATAVLAPSSMRASDDAEAELSSTAPPALLAASRRSFSVGT
jgi:WD40 repeat protein